MNVNGQAAERSSAATNVAPRQNMARRRGLLVLIVVGLAGLAAAVTVPQQLAGSAEAPEATAPVRPLPVRAIAVSPVSEFGRTIRYTGTIHARRSTDLSFERSARLVRLSVDEGVEVEAGQPLAELDTRHLETRRLELVAQLEEASAVLDELRAGPRRQTVNAAQAEVRDLTAQVEQLKRTYARRQTLAERNATTQQQLDDARFQLESLMARQQVAAQQLSELEEGTRPEKIRAQEASVARLEAQLKDLAIDMEESTLRAPYSGRIARRYVDEGTVVSADQPVFRLVEHQALEARIGLPATAAGRLQPGQRVQLLVADSEWPAVVERTLPEVDLSTRTRTVVFGLDASAASAVVPGEIARIELTQQTATDGFWLPATALTPDIRGLWSVYAVVDGVVERRSVELLQTETERVLVRGTLSEGDLIVTGGTQRIVPGQHVTVESD